MKQKPENRIKQLEAHLSEARAILLAQGFMGIQFTEAMTTAIKDFLEKTK